MRRKNFPRRVEARRAEAELRAADRARRTNTAQLAIMEGRRGNSDRERERLEALIVRGEI